MRNIYLTILFSSVLLLSGCTSKRLVNKADKFDSAGLYTDAAALYLKSLQANKNNIEAKLGLQRTGQMVLDDKIENFKSKYNTGSTKDAVYAYKKAEDYFHLLSSLGVQVITSEEQKVYYMEVRDKYLNTLYQDAMKALSLEEFNVAEKQFQEILRFDSQFKDAETQWVTAKFEPIYRHGNSLIETNSYRSAYADFDQINKATKGYKNSIALQQEALQNATLSIAFLPATSGHYSHLTVANQSRQQIIAKTKQIKSPFYKVIDGQSIQTIRGWDDIKDADMAIQLAKKYGNEFEAKSIFKTEIVKYIRNQGRHSKVQKKAYLKRTVETVNPETKLKEMKTIYDKVVYYEFRQKNELILQINYSLTRIDRDELAIANTFNASPKDLIQYAQFDGDYSRLVPGHWKSATKDSDEDKVYHDPTSINRLQALFKNKTEIKSIHQLESEALAKCAVEVAKQISEYQPEN
ncbi:hypothetical protein [Carboxylicivirga sp. N1Y90]|uniref:hypothetical protein n=1 Tax=Carboxylicivirga fragile TaxID=3417571 RepID=UPI003D3518FD|nr:hypothetical protein [Marinilabiliaceae bacterium N1Y90]